MDLQLEQVEELDRQVSEGQAFAYYEGVQISHANVYRNILSGRVGDLIEWYDVRVRIFGRQISGSCSCGESRQICRHIIALLYAWIQDGRDFVDIGEKIAEIKKLDHERLIEIVGNILRYNPALADLFFEKDRMDWDELDFQVGPDIN
ncbi:SWIM zinc finger family protein [candidate division KSB1 bacterium]|nr:SWIM zinc finger family protein [candidate division KSB1 bacterium]